MDSLSTIILGVALFVIMLGMGLSLVPDDFKRIFLSPKAIIIGLINQLILLPLIGFLIVNTFNLQPEVAVGLIILSACPGGPTSNLITHLAKGDTALSVSLTALSSVITIVTIPFIINLGLVMVLGEGTPIQLNISQTIIQVFGIIIIPISIGMFFKRTTPAFADKMNKPVKIASAALLALIIVGIVIKERANIIPYFGQAGWASLSLNVLTMVAGIVTARLFLLSSKQGLSIAIESGIQNGTLAISIATILLNNSAYAIAPAVYSLIMFFTCGIIIFWAQKSIPSAAKKEHIA